MSFEEAQEIFEHYEKADPPFSEKTLDLEEEHQ